MIKILFKAYINAKLEILIAIKRSLQIYLKIDKRVDFHQSL